MGAGLGKIVGDADGIDEGAVDGKGDGATVGLEDNLEHVCAVSDPVRRANALSHSPLHQNPCLHSHVYALPIAL